ncbi:Imm5 family immunity protein [Actinomadura kijaniata]|uniref:Imm5 family immunity protein n=1 Tax=Actinomadura kijaniata TaxID=46161 RepID=UPI003F1D1ECC
MPLDDDALRTAADGLPDSGELAYPIRRHLRQALTTRSDRALIEVELACVRRVHPAWANQYPDDPTPTVILQQALTGTDPAGAKRRHRSFLTHLDNLAVRQPPAPTEAIAAGMAYWALTRDVLYGIVPLPADPDDCDAYDETCSYYAAVAEAGGDIWSKSDDPLKRRAFWRWYLLEAIPSVLR